MVDYSLLEKFGHEQIVQCYNKESGLQALIAIHDTSLGPALGGVRLYNYSSTEDAVTDVLRLSRGMTYKAAAAGLNFGGGTAVIIANPKNINREVLFRTFGKFVNGLGGRFIGAEDVGTSVKDMDYIRMETKYVSGTSKATGGSGDPSPVTAYGVYIGIKACAKQRWGNDSLKGKKVAVQGAGQLSRYLCEHLYSEGAELIISDINEEKIKRVLQSVKADIVAPQEIYNVEADIFSPNALGAVINDETIPKFKFDIIAGGANNQLENEEKHDEALFKKGILYAPDYVINSGGLVNVANELIGYRQDRAMKQAENIYEIVGKVFNLSIEKNIPTNVASNNIAEQRLKDIRYISKIYSGSSDYSGRLGELALRS